MSKWQVGKRYRSKPGTYYAQVDGLCIFVDANGYGILKKNSNPPFVASHRNDWEIVPPEPRTGKGFLIKGLQNKTPYNAFFDVRPAAPVNGEVIEIEWKEIV